MMRDIFYSLDRHSKKWENYFQIYEKHFHQYIGKNPTILEIGIAHGGSTEMYKKYFGECTIYAVEYDPKFLNVVDELNVNVTHGDQGSSEFWQSFLVDKPNFDIIIDDGGHTMEQQIVTLVNTFPRLNINGTYLVEDTHTSYWREWGGGFRDPNTFIEMSKGLVELLHEPHINYTKPSKELLDIFKNLHSITYYNSIVVFEKLNSLPSIVANNQK